MENFIIFYETSAMFKQLVYVCKLFAVTSATAIQHKYLVQQYDYTYLVFSILFKNHSIPVPRIKFLLITEDTIMPKFNKFQYILIFQQDLICFFSSQLRYLRIHIHIAMNNSMNHYTRCILNRSDRTSCLSSQKPVLQVKLRYCMTKHVRVFHEVFLSTEKVFDVTSTLVFVMLTSTIAMQ